MEFFRNNEGKDVFSIIFHAGATIHFTLCLLLVPIKYCVMQDKESSKKDQYYIWRLIGQKLAGNASKNELQELQELLLDNPHIQYSMEILTGLSDPGNGSLEKEKDPSKKEVTARFIRPAAPFSPSRPLNK